MLVCRRWFESWLHRQWKSKFCSLKCSDKTNALSYSELALKALKCEIYVWTNTSLFRVLIIACSVVICDGGYRK